MEFGKYLKENFDVDFFPPLYHGTSSSQLIKTNQWHDKEVYLTDDYDEAEQFAHGVHLGGTHEKVKYVVTVGSRKGKVLDGNEVINSIIMEENEDFESIEQYLVWVKHKGYRYVTFYHPSTISYEEILVVISLFPNEDLQIIDVNKL
jgi:hypothetical protein